GFAMLGFAMVGLAMVRFLRLVLGFTSGVLRSVRLFLFDLFVPGGFLLFRPLLRRSLPLFVDGRFALGFGFFLFQILAGFALLFLDHRNLGRLGVTLGEPILGFGSNFQQDL